MARPDASSAGVAAGLGGGRQRGLGAHRGVVSECADAEPGADGERHAGTEPATSEPDGHLTRVAESRVIAALSAYRALVELHNSLPKWPAVDEHAVEMASPDCARR